MVVATGLKTFFGKTAQLVEETETQSFLQKTIIRIGDFLIILAVIMVTIIFIASLYVLISMPRYNRRMSSREK